MDCNICNQPSEIIFRKKVLDKYDVAYYRCNACGFIQTEKPYWLSEAYASAITSSDIGLVKRNLVIYPLLAKVIERFFNPDGQFVDYAGGYGLLVRIMRDNGFDFYRQDKFCENIFAKHFDVTAHTLPGQFELLTAFEVFEHLADPVAEIKQMFFYSDTVFFSTEIIPQKNIENWWYLSPHTGQHVAFYSHKSLQELANKLGCYYYKGDKSYHLLSRKKINGTAFSAQLLFLRSISFAQQKIFKRKSLLEKDYQMTMSL